MLKTNKAFSSFSVNDIQKAKDFYGKAFVKINLNTGTNYLGKPLVNPTKLKWFQNKKFRQAVSCGIDRDRSFARVDRPIRCRRKPDEMGAEQKAAFRSRDHQSHPEPRASHSG